MAESYKRLGEHLLASSQITNLQLALALAVQRTSSRRLGEILVSKGFITEQEIAEVLAKQFAYTIAEPSELSPSPEALALISFEKAIQTLTLPVRVRNGVLECVIADPIDVTTTDWLSRATGMRLSMRISTPSKIAAAIQVHYAKLTSRSSSLSDLPGVSLPERYRGVAPKLEFAGIYDSYDELLGRDVCLIEFSPSGNERQVNELVKRCAKAQSQNSCTIFDLHKQNTSTWWISTEKFEGETIAHLMETRGKRTPSQAATIITDLTATLCSEYAANGAFGFLSPENVVIRSNGSPAILPLSTDVENYRSPEDRERGHVTVQSDIFALGSLLNYCLANPTAQAQTVLPTTRALADIIGKCTAERAADRFESLGTLLSGLKSVNWSALAVSGFESSNSFRNDRDELLRDISTWNTPTKDSFWSKLFGRKAA